MEILRKHIEIEGNGEKKNLTIYCNLRKSASKLDSQRYSSKIRCKHNKRNLHTKHTHTINRQPEKQLRATNCWCLLLCVRFFSSLLLFLLRVKSWTLNGSMQCSTDTNRKIERDGECNTETFQARINGDAISYPIFFLTLTKQMRYFLFVKCFHISFSSKSARDILCTHIRDSLCGCECICLRIFFFLSSSIVSFPFGLL